ncbi:hypothetical protein CYY_006149 [Polysphondylium violaceum]|uniref:FNIP repeat-containing protein n=1 Tax=Polysphondylium violaceum TaxID=133409 RepID=A0A8J4PSD5_9MYCE|nr:hypothetical protein CYY_006149 [Polysphondylium violaceum]
MKTTSLSTYDSEDESLNRVKKIYKTSSSTLITDSRNKDIDSSSENNTTTTTTTTSTTITKIDTFFRIFRNSYIKRFIRNRVLQDLKLNINLSYLNNNHSYLDKLGEDEKIEYNILIGIIIQDRIRFLQFLNNPYKSLVNYLCVCNNVDISLQQQKIHKKDVVIDCDIIPQGIHRLELYVNDNHCGNVHLPHSIRQLVIKNEFASTKLESVFIQGILSNLPKNLVSLTLPNNLEFTKTDATANDKFVMPDSLTDLTYKSGIVNFERFVVSQTNKVFKSSVLDVDSMEGLSWLKGQTWITHLSIYGLPFNNNTFKAIPPHVCILDIFSQSLIETANEKLSLPTGLHTLKIYKYGPPIEPGLIPPQVKTLCLGHYYQRFSARSLPASLTCLSIGGFNCELDPFALPSQLKDLFMSDFDNGGYDLSKNSLPPSLASLDIPSFCGSFSSVGPLNNLTFLSVFNLNQSVSTIISNLKKVEIWFLDLDHGICLQQTSIQELCLHYNGVLKHIFFDEMFLPLSLLKLETNKKIYFKPNSIPSGCVHIVI